LVCRLTKGRSNGGTVTALFVVNAIAATAVSNANWAFHTILKFVMAQLERVNRKEIVISTLRGYIKTIKSEFTELYETER
jgi:hypothetical protein